MHIADRRRHPQILIIGFGARGRQWYAACRGRRDVEVVGVVDPSATAADAARLAGLTAFASTDEALSAAAATAAIVASPPDAHVADGLRLLGAGCTVLVEKPAALTLEDATRLSVESERLGVPVLVGQNFRFLPRERAVQKALADGFGPVLATTIVSARPAAAAQPHLAQVPYGAVWDICLHHLDAVRLRLGSAPETVQTVVRRPTAPGAGDRTHYRIALEWADGRSVAYEHSEGAAGYFHSEWIEGAGRAIVVRDQQVATVFPSARARRVRVPKRPVPEHALLDALVAVDAGGKPGGLGIADNLETVALVEAAVRSADLGAAVSPAVAVQGDAVRVP